MLKIIGIVLLLVLGFVGARHWSHRAEAADAAKSFALKAPEVIAAIGKGATVVGTTDSTRTWNPQDKGGKECATYRLLLRGDVGQQWVRLEVARPAKGQPWDLVRLQTGAGDPFKNCISR